MSSQNICLQATSGCYSSLRIQHLFNSGSTCKQHRVCPDRDGEACHLTWSMAHGIRHRMSFLVPNMWGKESGNDGAAWMAGKEIFPMLSSPVNPKIPFTWFRVTHLFGVQQRNQKTHKASNSLQTPKGATTSKKRNPGFQQVATIMRPSYYHHGWGA